MTRILVHARGAVGRNMGSTGVRCYHMARVLAEQLPEAQVTLAAPNQVDIPPPHPRVRIVCSRRPLVAFFEMLRHDVIISRNFPPYAALFVPFKRLALDFYTFFAIEWLEITKWINNPRRKRVWMESNVQYIACQLTMADYVFCCNERQRDAWLGALAMLGLVPPDVYDRDPTLRRLSDVVPHGVRPGQPRHARRVLKGVVPGIAESDKVLLWNSSVMEWFDAETVIRAMADVSRVRDDVKLFVLGTEHPDMVASVDTAPVRKTIQMSKDLGLYERSVFFNLGWVPYEELGDYLAEADLGVCAAYDTLEARYAFRTRYLDLFWAALPIVCTAGDELAERIAQAPLGIVVPPGEHRAFAEAVLRLLDDPALYRECRENLKAVRKQLTWERALAPLVEFCRNQDAIAAPKRRRFVPLLWRTIGYLISHLRQRRMPDRA